MSTDTIELPSPPAPQDPKHDHRQRRQQQCNHEGRSIVTLNSGFTLNGQVEAIHFS